MGGGPQYFAGLEIMPILRLYRKRISLAELHLVPVWISLRQITGLIQPSNLLFCEFPADGPEVLLQLLFVPGTDHDA